MNRRSKAKLRTEAAPVGMDKTRWWLSAVWLVGVTLLAYIPALRSGFIWDDDLYITNNPALRTIGGLWDIWLRLGATSQYYPLVFTTFWLEFHCWGLDPFGFHLVNVLLHACSVILLWRLLRQAGVPGSLLAASIFALHPVHVESVAWVTERKNVLSGFFYLLAFWAYLRFDPLEPSAGRRVRRTRWYLLVLLFFAAALFSKTVTCTLPGAIFLLYWWKRDRLRPSDCLPLAPLLAMGLVMARVTAWTEYHYVGTSGVTLGLSPAGRILLAGRAIWFYLGKLIWPHPLIFFYDKWAIDPHAAAQYLYPLAVLFVAIALWLARQRLGKGPIVLTLFFIGSLVPALGFFDVYPMRHSWVADHFQYLASIGPIIAAAALLTRVTHRSLLGERDHWGRRIAAAASFALLALLAAMTWRQSGIYHDSITLYTETIRRNPRAWVAYNNLGVLRLRTGHQTDEALRLCREALRLNPEYAEAHVNVGGLLAQSGRPSEALDHLFKAVELKPGLAIGHYTLAGALADVGRIDEAQSEFHEAVRLEPKNWDARVEQAKALWRGGRIDLAIAEYREILALNPGHQDARKGLDAALRRRTSP